MTHPRIAPGTRKDIGIINDLFARLAGRVTGTGRPNIFTTLGRRRGLFRAWLIYSATMMPGGKLPRRETEAVILNIAHRRGCDYEREHHERLGRRVGLTDAEIAQVGNKDWDGWSPRMRAMFAAVEQLGTDGDIDDPTWKELRRHLDEPRTIELLMLAGQYDSLATTLLTLRVQPDGS